jgi:hypothetical protein
VIVFAARRAREDPGLLPGRLLRLSRAQLPNVGCPHARDLAVTSSDSEFASAPARLRRAPVPPEVRPSLPLWNAMKEGLLGGRLSVSPKSESKEARCSCCTLDWI